MHCTSGRVRGHPHPDYTDSKEAMRTVGPGAIERAYERRIRAAGRTDELPPLAPGEHLQALSAWAVGSRALNGKPWRHIGVKIGT